MSRPLLQLILKDKQVCSVLFCLACLLVVFTEILVQHIFIVYIDTMFIVYTDTPVSFMMLGVG